MTTVFTEILERDISTEKHLKPTICLDTKQLLIETELLAGK